LKLFEALSIKNKLIGIILLVSVLAITSGFTVVIITNVKSFKSEMLHSTIIKAKLIGEYCVAPLVFEDKSGAEEILQKLQADKHIMIGCVYDENGKLFAWYIKPGETIIPLDIEQIISNEYISGFLHVKQPILYDGKKCGSIHLRVSTGELNNRIKNYLITMLLLTVGLMFLSYFLASKFQKVISKPILTLAEVTREISSKGDYSVRVEKKGTDEIGVLYDGFNDMLEQIHIRETERKHVEEALQKAHDELEVKVAERTAELAQANIRLQELDRLKSIFLASTSHELRTPLNSIIGFTGIMLQGMSGEITEEQRKQLAMVKNSANHLLSLINDILDISKIEAEKVELMLKEFSLNTVVREVVEAFSPKAREKGLELLMEVPEGIMLFSDRRRIKQVLMNLVSNAVKFTDQGSVNIATRVPGDDNLEIRVIDTGIGIKQDDINKLFAPFQQIDVSLTKKHEGTGLGLHLTKKLVTLLGGDISAKSEYGRGSEFTFTIPLRYKEEN